MNGNKFRKLREDRGLLQKELADKLNTSTSAIGMYEQGRRQPDNEMLKRISNYFRVSIDYLLDNDITDTIDSELKNKETLRKILKQVGFVDKEDDLTDKQLEKVMEFLITNKKFLINK